MQLLVDEQQQIISYAIFGDLVGGVTYDGKGPATFTNDFQTGRYLLQNDQIVTNPNYVAPTPPADTNTSTPEQKLLIQQGQDIVQLKQLIMNQAMSIATLTKGGTK